MAPAAARTRLVSVLAFALCALGGAEEATSGPNLAATAAGGTVVAVSSQVKLEDGRIDPQWAVSNAFDGVTIGGERPSTESLGWASSVAPQVGQPEWVVLAFGPEAPVTRIGSLSIDPATPSPSHLGRWVRTVELQVSPDTQHGPYQSVGRFLLLNEPRLQRFDFPPVACRYARLLLLENHGSDRCVELGEIQLSAPGAQTDTVAGITEKLRGVLDELIRLRDAHRAEATAGYGPIAAEGEVIVPSVVHLPEAEARRVLSEAGLRPAEASIGLADEQVEQGGVIAQDLPAGSVAPRNAVVQLTVSRGAEAGDAVEPEVVVTEDPAYAAAWPGTGKRRFEVGVTARGVRKGQKIVIRKSDDRKQGEIVADMTLDPEQTREWVATSEGPVTIEVLHEGRVVFSKHYALPDAQ